jgi:hypothetical protein
VGILVLEAGEADHIDEAAGDARPLVLCDALQTQAKLDVGLRRLPGQQRILLEDHAAIRARPRDLGARDPDFAVGRPIETGDNAQERRFPAPGRPDNGHELMRPDAQRDVVQRVNVLAERRIEEGLRDAARDQDLRHVSLHHLRNAPCLAWTSPTTRLKSTR